MRVRSLRQTPPASTMPVTSQSATIEPSVASTAVAEFCIATSTVEDPPSNG